MFYYYGRKKQIAKYYPQPQLDHIVEPFAGAASYSLHANNWKHRVTLVEKDPRVAEIWQWLIDNATGDEILSLPSLEVGERSSEFLHIIHAVTKMAFKYKTIRVTPILQRNWEISKRVMAANIHKVKHWELIIGDFTLAPNIEATWFIDPPYQDSSGEGYMHGSKQMDYASMAEWAMSRRGQLICCEGRSGDYLPFSNLIELSGVAGKLSTEKIYHRPRYDSLQKSLF